MGSFKYINAVGGFYIFCSSLFCDKMITNWWILEFNVSLQPYWSVPFDYVRVPKRSISVLGQHKTRLGNKCLQDARTWSFFLISEFYILTGIYFIRYNLLYISLFRRKCFTGSKLSLKDSCMMEQMCIYDYKYLKYMLDMLDWNIIYPSSKLSQYMWCMCICVCVWN